MYLTASSAPFVQFGPTSTWPPWVLIAPRYDRRELRVGLAGLAADVLEVVRDRLLRGRAPERAWHRDRKSDREDANGEREASKRGSLSLTSSPFQPPSFSVASSPLAAPAVAARWGILAGADRPLLPQSAQCSVRRNALDRAVQASATRAPRTRMSCKSADFRRRTSCSPRPRTDALPATGGPLPRRGGWHMLTPLCARASFRLRRDDGGSEGDWRLRELRRRPRGRGRRPRGRRPDGSSG